MLAESLFMQHIADFGLSYGTIEEFNFRKDIFMEAESEILSLNSQNGTATFAHNFMSTMTYAEKKRMLGFIDMGEAMLGKESNFPPAKAAEVNWVTAGAVTEVKNQGSCGSCWSFSTTGAVEGSYQINGNTLTSFSEEELVQCDTMTNHGCNGGSMALAFKWLESHTLNTEENYPYTSGKGVRGECNTALEHGPVKVTDYTQVKCGRFNPKPAPLVAALEHQPVSVAIEADQRAFQNYHSGVLTEGCGTKLDHGVLAVGYGTENGTPYFLVKNSWGPTWGDKGYIKIGQNNVCGILSQPVFANAVAAE